MAKKRKPCVLILCEESQTECKAFREAGFEAYSCDIQREHGDHAEWHAQYPAEFFLNGGKRFYTNDGVFHYVPRWSLIIAHPPCTYLCRLSGVKLRVGGQIDKLREAYMIVAADFFWKCLAAPANYVAVENPVPLKAAGLPKPDAFVEPYWYGHPYSKKTCLWLKNLPPLMPTIINPEQKQWVRSSRGRYRSRSFTGIAKAMAEQWGALLIEKHGPPPCPRKPL